MMTKTPQPKSGISEISPYVPGEAGPGGAHRVIKLSCERNAVGCRLGRC